MKINQAGTDLIKSFEGLRLVAYKDSVGVITVGYGATGVGINENTVWTKNQADDRLATDLCKFESGVQRILDSIGVSIDSNQFSALVCFSYNLGLTTLSNSSIIRNIDNDNMEAAAECFLKYVYAGKQKLQGLVNRRTAEMNLFNTAVTQ